MAVKNVTVPDLGGAADVTVIEVLVKAGDQITVDTPIVTLESDKATMEVPSTDTGVIKEIKVNVGDKVSSGAVLIVVETTAAEARQADTAKTGAAKPSAPVERKSEKRVAAKEKPEEKPLEAPSTAQSTESTSKSTPVLSGTVQSTTDVHAGPGVRRLAREFGVNLTLVSGSGPKQRILKEDVQAFVKNQLTQLQTSTPGTMFPALPAVDFSKFGPIDTQALSRIKKISGKNPQRNWMMIPHVTQFADADITALDEFRQARKHEFEK